MIMKSHLMLSCAILHYTQACKGLISDNTLDLNHLISHFVLRLASDALRAGPSVAWVAATTRLWLP